ncbi:MAG: DMT family transporter, partial [Chlamydiia bacterium]|nr:DMT family transporter [Chlamydiia bacterium]
PMLGEHMDFPRIAAIVLGFLGVSIVLGPSCWNLCWGSLTLVLATAIYAFLDVLNKRLVSELSTMNMLFFSSLVGTAFAALPALGNWTAPSLLQLSLLAFLGATANLILYCMLRAFQLERASFLSPFRYIELVFSAVFGFLIFGEVPTTATVLGAIVIVGSMLGLSLLENRGAESHEALV